MRLAAGALLTNASSVTSALSGTLRVAGSRPLPTTPSSYIRRLRVIARVMDMRGNRVEGLFACGACAAGTLTGAIYFTGTAVGHAIVFGTLAAETVSGD